MFIGMIGMLFMSLMVGCSTFETGPQGRNKYIFYHKPLPEASRALEEARMAGKDKQCPAEFNAANDMVDKAYQAYEACHTQESITMAQEAIAKIEALCPPKEVAAPAPVEAPAPAPAVVVAPSRKEMTFPEAAMFAIDKSELTPEGKQKILEYREEAKAELSTAISVRIIGYTDNTGSAEYNKQLSLKRAQAVRDYFVELGVDASKMEVIGMGEDNPIADNATAAGRAKNRRVVVEVTGLGK